VPLTGLLLGGHRHRGAPDTAVRQQLLLSGAKRAAGSWKSCCVQWACASA